MTLNQVQNLGLIHVHSIDHRILAIEPTTRDTERHRSPRDKGRVHRGIKILATRTGLRRELDPQLRTRTVGAAFEARMSWCDVNVHAGRPSSRSAHVDMDSRHGNWRADLRISMRGRHGQPHESGNYHSNDTSQPLLE